MDNLRQLDLNLLVALDILLDERSVTRAASRLSLSQPATSATLARLRAHLGDRLLVRSRGEMLLTRRATVLRQPIKDALRAISNALDARETFDPRALEHTFRITMTDIAAAALAPRLAAALHRKAPYAALEVMALDRLHLHESLRNATVDAAVIVATTEDHKFESEPLFDDEIVFLTAPDHPLARVRRVRPEVLVKYPLVEVSFASGLMRPTFEHLASLGLNWAPTLTVPHFLIVPTTLGDAPFVGIMGRRVAERYVQAGAAAIVKSFLPPPIIHYRLAWHRRLAHDPGHVWVRGLIQSVARGL